MERPELWEWLSQEVMGEKGVVMLIGAPDTGKTTLCHFLISQALRQGIRTAYVDGDIGQSVIGPPTTLGMALLEEPPEDFSHLPWDLLYFIGSPSPARHLLPVAVGLKRLVDKAKEKGAELIVVDTTGLVAGEVGFELKFYKMELLRPQALIALQRQDELEHILKGCRGRDGVSLYVLPPSEGVVPRSPERRREYRQRRFEEYFKWGRKVEVDVERTVVIDPAFPLLNLGEDDGRLVGRLLGLNDGQFFTLGLGIWEGVDEGKGRVYIYTPLEETEAVRFLQLGHITLRRG